MVKAEAEGCLQIQTDELICNHYSHDTHETFTRLWSECWPQPEEGHTVELSVCPNTHTHTHFCLFPVIAGCAQPFPHLSVCVH